MITRKVYELIAEASQKMCAANTAAAVCLAWHWSAGAELQGSAAAKFHAGL
jgi:hypothetical protein